jgi:hypothetical protein
MVKYVEKRGASYEEKLVQLGAQASENRSLCDSVRLLNGWWIAGESVAVGHY